MSIVQPNSTDVSAIVSEVVSEVLGQPVDLNENLLELGVDSLVGTRIVIGIRSKLNLEVPLVLLFENPVLGDFSQAVTECALEQGD